MIEWEPNKNDANLNMPVDGQVASICWNEQTKLLTMSLAYSAVYGMGERFMRPAIVSLYSTQERLQS